MTTAQELLAEMRQKIAEAIAQDREIMEHAIIALVGVEYLEDFIDDDRILREEFHSMSPDWGDQADALRELRASLQFIVARKAADIYRRGNDLPVPDERTDSV